MLVPVVNIVVGIMLGIKFAKSFGKSTGFGIVMFFLPTLCYGVLAIGNAEYIGPQID